MGRLSHCRQLLICFLIACSAAISGPDAAYAQLLEFVSAEVRGRIDRSSLDNTWTVGDDNGNGSLDDGETFATRVNIEEVFLDDASYVYIGPDRSELRRANDRLTRPAYLGIQNSDLRIGFRDYGGAIVDSDVDLRAGGVVDDLDGDLASGPVFITGDTNGDGTIDDDELVGIAIDYGDIYSFDIMSGLNLSARPFVTHSSVQLMQVLRFDVNPDYSLSAADETLEIGYGARFLGGSQDQPFDLRSFLLLGANEFRSTLENRAMGPQASVRWTSRRGRWQARAEATAAVTYMQFDGDSSYRTGDNLVPGGLNQPAILQRSIYRGHVEGWDVAPVVEAGLIGSYDITSSARAFIRCDAMQFHEVRGVQRAIVWRLPEMGLRDPGGQDITVTSASIGVEVRR